jgi:hypothetical protein
MVNATARYFIGKAFGSKQALPHNDRRLRPWLASRAVRGGDRDHSDLMVQLDFTSNAGTSRAAIIPQISQ